MYGVLFNNLLSCWKMRCRKVMYMIPALSVRGVNKSIPLQPIRASFWGGFVKSRTKVSFIRVLLE